jgi:methionyl-tRNA formyltransferase
VKILILKNIRTPISRIIEQSGDDALEWSDPIDSRFIEQNGIDFAISHGYRHIIKEPIINCLHQRIINLHISLLPWNKGADPNLWSFLDDTPKGVTIHYVDERVDTGDIIVQKEVVFKDYQETLATTYQILQAEIADLFKAHWPLIRDGRCPRLKQVNGGTFHKSIDKRKYENLLVAGWETPISPLIGKGKIQCIV